MAHEKAHIKEVLAETLAYIESVHSDILARYVCSRPNELQLEIRLFRSCIARLAEWAVVAGDRQFTAHVRWRENYWFEREYIESEFEDLSEADAQRWEEASLAYARQHVPLWAPMIEPVSFSNEISQSAASPQAQIPSINAVSLAPTWSDLDFTINQCGPATSHSIINIICDAISLTNDEYSVAFLDFLLSNQIYFRIEWIVDAAVRLKIFSITDNEQIYQFVSKSIAIREWVLSRDRIAAYDCSIYEEAHFSKADFRRDMLKRIDIAA